MEDEESPAEYFEYHVISEKVDFFLHSPQNLIIKIMCLIKDHINVGSRLIAILNHEGMQLAQERLLHDLWLVIWYAYIYI